MSIFFKIEYVYNNQRQLGKWIKFFCYFTDQGISLCRKDEPIACDINFVLRKVNGDRRNTCGVLLRTWTIHREYLSKRCFSPRESALSRPPPPAPPPALTKERHEASKRTACIKTLISWVPLIVPARETIEETARQAEGNSRRVEYFRAISNSFAHTWKRR